MATLQQRLETESQRISEIQLVLQRSPMDGGVGEGGLGEGGVGEGGLGEGGVGEGGLSEDGDNNEGGPQPPASGPGEGARGMIGGDDGHLPEWVTLSTQVSDAFQTKSSLARQS